jgi:NitT/TauT family transport system permease protein
MTTAIGFLVAVAAGLLGGIAIGSSTLVYDSFYPALIGFNSIPKVAVVTILVIWFGVGTAPAVTAFLIAFFPILVTGLRPSNPSCRTCCAPWVPAGGR